jgi:arginine-tRNA-protein transferase
MEEAAAVLDRLKETRYEWGPCPYGAGRAHVVSAFSCERINEGLYETALADGWRRSGRVFYRNRCEGCDACVPIRVDALNVRPSKSQRRAARANADLSVSLGRLEFTEEDYSLFRRYLAARHPEDVGSLDEAGYRASYIESSVEGRIARYRKPDGSLVALGFLDALVDGLSSVYFAFDPDESARSLGVFSVLAECAIARSLGMRWYYLGFHVAGCRKMAYKASFAPHETARAGVWKSGDNGGAQ